MRKIIDEVVANEKNKKKEKKSVKNSDKKPNILEDSLTRGVNNRELEEVLAGLTTTIKVVGCGGAGTNTISRCIEGGISGAELVSLNTDAQHLLLAGSPHKVLIGRHLTHGLGAGSLPQIGEDAARESEKYIREAVGRAIFFIFKCLMSWTQNLL